VVHAPEAAVPVSLVAVVSDLEFVHHFVFNIREHTLHRFVSSTLAKASKVI
jgi:hypothetical protein